MPDAIDVLAALVLEDGRRWGEVAEPFQWQDARAILDPDTTTPYSFLTRSRGASKTADLAGVAVAAMLAAATSGIEAVRPGGRPGSGPSPDRVDRGLPGPHARASRDVGDRRVQGDGDEGRLDAWRSWPLTHLGRGGCGRTFVIVDEICQWADTACGAEAVGGRHVGGSEDTGLPAGRPDDGGRPGPLVAEDPRSRDR